MLDLSLKSVIVLEPFQEESSVEEPVKEEPSVEEPVEEPVVEEPVVEEPVVEEPVVEEPVVEEPVEEPIEEPVVEEPVVEEPIMDDLVEVVDCEMNEVSLEDLVIDKDEICKMSVENNDFANIYEMLDRKINEDILEHLKITLLRKKIKVNIDLNELFEEDNESDSD